MNFTKKIDRAVQWAGEKMGAEAKTTMSDEFKMLETEMALRFDGMERLQKSMNAYVKWLGRRSETFEDKEKGLPASYLGRTMVSHGEDFEPDSDFGNCLIDMGHTNERLAALQEQFVAEATTTWLESLERSLAMMKEYQSARKKLENRRLAYDASTTKMQKSRRDDFRIEEEMRTNKAKYDESCEDVLRRMQDIKDAEVDSVRDLTGFLDAELDYHERCVEELRRVRTAWPAQNVQQHHGAGSKPLSRSRSNTAQSHTAERVSSHRSSRPPPDLYEEEPEQQRPSPVRSLSSKLSLGGCNTSSGRTAHRGELPSRPAVVRANTFQGGGERERSALGSTTPGAGYGAQDMAMLRGQLRPLSRINTTGARYTHGRDPEDVFADRDDDTTTASGSGSPEWGERSASPATSFGSLSRSTSNVAGSATGGFRKAPPPPPPSRAKKPPPPVPAKRELGY